MFSVTTYFPSFLYESLFDFFFNLKNEFLWQHFRDLGFISSSLKSTIPKLLKKKKQRRFHPLSPYFPSTFTFRPNLSFNPNRQSWSTSYEDNPPISLQRPPYPSNVMFIIKSKHMVLFLFLIFFVTVFDQTNMTWSMLACITEDLILH
jgi:hypothetical protein